jgi:excisionase family DNA binding protein
MQTNEIATRADIQLLQEKLTKIETTLQSIAGIKPDDDELLDRQEVARMLRVSVATIGIMTHDGRLKGARVGRQIRYRRKDVMKALDDIKDKQYKR